MAKVKQKQSKVNKVIQSNYIDEKIGKYFWLIIPILTVIYFLSSRYSVGFYQDDEISQYINMIDFWVNPSVILGNAPKPGWKIFLVLPALVSYDFVLVFNSFIASITVFITYRMLRVYQLKNAVIGGLLLAVQPLYFDLSFRSYPEIFTALTFALFLIAMKKEKYFLSALIAGYIYTFRQEIALLLVILFIFFLYKKKYLAILGLAVAPLIYNILGYLKTGDPIFVISEMFRVAGLEYRTQGPLHYFKFYIFIVGPISLTLFLNGFFSFFALGWWDEIKSFLVKNFWFYAIFLIVFITQILTTLGSGPNPGNWRYLLHLSPICIYFAVIGLNNIAEKNYRMLSYIVPAILLFLTFLFLSKVSDGYVFKEPPQTDYTKAIFILIYFVIISIFSYKKDANYLNKVALLLLFASIVYLVIDFKPKQLSQENLTMKKCAEYISEINIPDTSKIFTNHFLTRFFYKNYKNNPEKFYPIWSKRYTNKDTTLLFIENAPAGSIIVWEPHYSYRIYNKDTVGIEEKIILSDTIQFKLLQQIVAPDKKSFYSYIFQKK
ncbi:MAG: glycosyltransferase family 39 protein [Ignavibacteria bacterium]|nr:glycosyltransferase family 39 protein [Ignavibacteria bacterium]